MPDQAWLDSSNSNVSTQLLVSGTMVGDDQLRTPLLASRSADSRGCSATRRAGDFVGGGPAANSRSMVRGRGREREGRAGQRFDHRWTFWEPSRRPHSALFTARSRLCRRIPPGWWKSRVVKGCRCQTKSGAAPQGRRPATGIRRISVSTEIGLSLAASGYLRQCRRRFKCRDLQR